MQYWQPLILRRKAVQAWHAALLNLGISSLNDRHLRKIEKFEIEKIA
jgi:hypothetical protein